MSSIQLLIYDVIDHHDNNAAKKTGNAAHTGVKVTHLSIVVHGEEFEYGKNGVNVSYEPVSVKRSS